MTDWDSRYRSCSEVNRTPEPLLVRHASVLAPGRALDLACGLGRNAIWLAGAGWEVTAVDRSKVAVEAVRQILPAAQVLAADLETGEFIPAAETYGLVCCFLYLQRDLFPAMRDSLAHGGLLLARIAMEDDDPGVRPMNPSYLLGPGELFRLLGPLTVVEYEEKKPGPGVRRMASAAARRV